MHHRVALLTGGMGGLGGAIAVRLAQSGCKGAFGQVNYSGAKAGMHGFTKALTPEVATKHITVKTVSLGYLATS
jgi:NAD(P)-dependent dehydrogenase (short-subunit alcohol dehydrogenase family)